MALAKRVILLFSGLLLVLSALTACGAESSDKSETTSGSAPTSAEPTTAALPASGTFTGSLPGKDGAPAMALAISVAGDKVVAYACNGTTDSAWFRGTQKDGALDLTSDYLDTLEATFDGTNLNTTVTVNDITYTGTVAAAPPGGGIYTATDGDARASWVAINDQTTVGVVQPNSKNDREVIDKINKQQQDFKDQVRQARLNRQLQQAQALNVVNRQSSINGRTVTAVSVNATQSSLPNSP